METPQRDGFSISWMHPGQGSLPRRLQGNRKRGVIYGQRRRGWRDVARAELGVPSASPEAGTPAPALRPSAAPPLPTHPHGCFWEEREWEFRVPSLEQDLAPLACGQSRSQRKPPALQLPFIESQNHRMVWVGRDLEDHLAPTPLP